MQVFAAAEGDALVPLMAVMHQVLEKPLNCVAGRVIGVVLGIGDSRMRFQQQLCALPGFLVRLHRVSSDFLDRKAHYAVDADRTEVGQPRRTGASEEVGIERTDGGPRWCTCRSRNFVKQKVAMPEESRRTDDVEKILHDEKCGGP
jgi:hypothetical protein